MKCWASTTLHIPLRGHGHNDEQAIAFLNETTQQVLIRASIVSSRKNQVNQDFAMLEEILIS